MTSNKVKHDSNNFVEIHIGHLVFLKMNLPLISTSEPKNFSAVAEGGEGFLLPPPFLLLLGVDIVIISCSISFLLEFFHYDLFFFVSSKRLISIIFLSTVADVRIYNSRLESKKVVSLTQLLHTSLFKVCENACVDI